MSNLAVYSPVVSPSSLSPSHKDSFELTTISDISLTTVPSFSPPTGPSPYGQWTSDPEREEREKEAQLARDPGPEEVQMLPLDKAYLHLLFNSSVRAIKTNLVPGLVLQALSLFIIILYYSSSGANYALNVLGDFKASYEVAFAICSSAFFGGFLPITFKYFVKHIEAQKKMKRGEFPQSLAVGTVDDNTGIASNHSSAYITDLIFYSIFWGYKGIEVNYFYRLQGVMFGEDSSFGVVFPKVCVDMFIYNPIWAGPTLIAIFMWKECGFDIKEAVRRVKLRFYYAWQLPQYCFSNWIIWIPLVTIIYLLPPLFLSCFRKTIPLKVSSTYLLQKKRPCILVK
jgi:hypothetical protein